MQFILVMVRMSNFKVGLCMLQLLSKTFSQSQHFNLLTLEQLNRIFVFFLPPNTRHVGNISPHVSDIAT